MKRWGQPCALLRKGHQWAFGRRLGVCPLFVILAVAGLIGGCQTRQEPVPENAVSVGSMVPFSPLRHRAPIQHAEGRYPDLFTPASYALWVDAALSLERMAEATEADEAPDAQSASQAAVLDAAFQVIECHLESLFPDGAIAYDVVALRGLDVYLETYDGKVIRPARMSAGALTEGRQGAILQFSRPVLVGFPREEIQLVVAAQERDGATVRLVLEGHGTKFYFEWAARLPEVYDQARLIPPEKITAAKMGFKAYYEKLRSWAHNFD